MNIYVLAQAAVKKYRQVLQKLLTILKVGKPHVRVWPIWFTMKALFLICRLLPFHCVLYVLFFVWACSTKTETDRDRESLRERESSLLSLLKRALILSCRPKVLPKGPTCKDHHTESEEFNTWIWGGHEHSVHNESPSWSGLLDQKSITLVHGILKKILH